MINVLLVDDQKAIIQSLVNGIHWESLPVQEVYTAGSAIEAKLVLMNAQVDLLITDIEMPEEDGLSLFSWAKQQFPDLEGIFLTSHADFAYAKQAIGMGGFDYILQPVRYGDVERVIERAYQKISSSRRIHGIVDTQKLMVEQRSTILTAAISNVYREKYDEADRISDEYQKINRAASGEAVLSLIRIQRWKRITNVWEDSLITATLRNIASEIFGVEQTETSAATLRENEFWLTVSPPASTDGELLREYFRMFAGFINEHLDFRVSVYPDLQRDGSAFSQRARRLLYTDSCNSAKTLGVLWKTEMQNAADENEEADFIAEAIDSVRRNISRPVTRAEVAAQVHLNEDYFSRAFRNKTGDTFKNFVTFEKMREAEKLLTQTKLSVSIIASKVGYDNFSHFSQTFKKYSGKTPQEYRKDDIG